MWRRIFIRNIDNMIDVVNACHARMITGGILVVVVVAIRTGSGKSGCN
jgi:hypothetical protein